MASRKVLQSPDGSILTIINPNMQLRQARIASGLTQRAVAEKIGVEGLTVRRWELLSLVKSYLVSFPNAL